MKLAEALLLRGDMQKKLASLRERIANNVLVQEGEKPHEDPAKLMKEAIGVIDEIEQVTIKTNAANLANELPDGRSLTAAIAHRDSLTKQHSLLQTAISGTRREVDRYSMSEIKWKAVVDVRKLQKQSDDVAGKIRELNALIQEANWKIELE